MSGSRRAVFLDRDGVLNDSIVVDGKPFPPRRLSELVIPEAAVRGCELLRAAGFTLVCVTNQPDVATGLLAQSDLDAINGAIVGRLQLDALRYCPHVDTDGCACRKPKPGLLVDAARSLDLDLSGSYMVGDRWRDIDAGRSAGCRSVFIDRGYAERRACGMDFVCGDLADAAAWIIRDSSLGGRGLERSDL